MANEIKGIFDSGTLTITLASLASSTTGAGQQSTIVDNSTTGYQIIHLFCKITVGTTPTQYKNIYIYLIKSDGTLRSDGAGASDTTITRYNARLIGVMNVALTTSDKAYYGEFTIRNPGKEWGVIVVHDSVAALNATGGNHSITWVAENPEVQ